MPCDNSTFPFIRILLMSVTCRNDKNEGKKYGIGDRSSNVEAGLVLYYFLSLFLLFLDSASLLTGERPLVSQDEVRILEVDTVALRYTCICCYLFHFCSFILLVFITVFYTFIYSPVYASVILHFYLFSRFIFLLFTVASGSEGKMNDKTCIAEEVRMMEIGSIALRFTRLCLDLFYCSCLLLPLKVKQR